VKIETLEAKITAIWKELLQVPDVDLDDHFLDLGGDSMMALRLKARIQDGLRVEMTAEMLFNCSTVRELARALTPLLKSQ
jgi:yersiniabactin nonribosomal peptide synthetase